MNKHQPPSPSRIVSLFRNGRNQAIRIPVEFEFPGTEVLVRKEGDALIVEPAPLHRPRSFAGLMESFEVIEDAFPDIEDSPPRQVDL